MKKTTLLLGLVFAAGFAVAQQDESAQDKSRAKDSSILTDDTSPSKTEAKAEAKADKDKKDAIVQAEIVSVDTSAKTITVKTTSSSTTSPSTGSSAAMAAHNMTLPVQGKAVSSLKDIQAGDVVSLTCRADASKKADASVSTSASSRPACAG